MKKKKSNTKSVILNGVALLLSALTMIFYACAHYTGKAGSLTGSKNGFETIQEMFDVSNKASATVAGIMILIVFITAAIVFLLAVVNMLGALGVIKNVRVLRAINMLTSWILALAGIIGVICLAVYLKDISVLSIEYKNGWANIINMILAIGTCTVVTLDYLTTRK